MGAEVKTAQINALLAVLGEIRDRLPTDHLAAPELIREEVTTVTGRSYFVDAMLPAPEVPDVAPGAATVDLRAAWMREALGTFQEVLDGWIEGAYENHQACGHRAEPVGGECWRWFHPQDIRRMVADAARELRVKAPDVAVVPKEDLAML